MTWQFDFKDTPGCGAWYDVHINPKKGRVMGRLQDCFRFLGFVSLILILTVVFSGCGEPDEFRGSGTDKPLKVDKSKSGIEGYIAGLSDEDPSVRMIAARSLGKAGPKAEAAVPALIKRLHGDDQLAARYTCAWALGEIGPVNDKVVPALIKALDDSVWSVRKNAALALGEIGPPSKAAVPRLIELLEDRVNEMREAAAKSLGEIGPNAKPAVAALTKALEDEGGKRIQNAARLALEKINADPAKPDPGEKPKSTGGR